MSVKVAVRVRPFNQRQNFLGCLNCIQMKDKTTILINPRNRNQKQHQFTFDYSLWSHDGFQELQNGYLYPIDDRFVDQKRVFKELGEEIIKNAWNGFNCCLFAYGQTGSGKSYSMIGYDKNRGIVPMACQKIFQGIEKTKIKGKKQFEVTLSMVEIYNEKVQDLFVHTNKRPQLGLKIRQNKKFGVYVEGITRFQVKNYADIQKKMEDGIKNRSLAATLMNQYSSRAHTIVIIQFIQKQFITEQKMNKKSSLLNLVDLAGSERAAKTGVSDKDRLKEASQINKSLHTLGRVIEHLAELSAGKTKNISIPYRQSALTRILETALGGNSVTTMICAVSPANDNYEETLSTLRYADQAKRIRNKPIINQSAVDKIIRELREQNERLKQMLRISKLKGIKLDDGIIEANIHEIQRELRKNMQSFAINTDEMEDEDYSNIMMTEFIQLPDPSEFNPNEVFSVSQFDTSLKIQNVYLTNLSEDPMLSHRIRYSCQNELYVGNKHLNEAGNNKLTLCGLGIQNRHARIFQANNKFYIEPLSEQAAEYTMVNGRSVDKATQILHNDRIIFGTNSVFLFKNNINQQMRKNGTIKICSNHQYQAIKNIRSSFAEGTNTMYKNKQSFNQSLLLDDLDLSTSQVEPAQQQLNPNIQTIRERDIDYQFAINQRQNKLETSTSFLSNINSEKNSEMKKNLLQIQKQFQLLMAENERKMKEKEQKYKEQLKRIQTERQIEKQKLHEELKQKELQHKQICNDRQKIQKARNALLQLQKQRKQKQANEDKVITKTEYIQRDHHHFNYECNLIQNPGRSNDYGNQNNQYYQNNTIINNNNQYSKGQNNLNINDSPNHIQQKKHQQKQQIQEYKKKYQNETEFEINTTNSTMMANHQDQSLLLEHTELQLPDISKNAKFEKKIQQKTNLPAYQVIQKNKRNLTLSSNTNYFTHEPIFIPNRQVNNQSELSKIIEEKRAEVLVAQKIEQQQKQLYSENLRKHVSLPDIGEKIPPNSSLNQLNLTDILYGSPVTTHIKPLKKNSAQQYVQEESNLLNFTNSGPLSCYIPLNKKQSQSIRSSSYNSEKMKQSYANISLNLSDDIGMQLQLCKDMKEQELNNKIKELQEKLKSLENTGEQKKANIRQIRQSFVQDFGEPPNTENFFIDGYLQSDLDLSIIPIRKNSDSISQELQKKLKMSMMQCQNENIINERNLQIRKRKRQAEELKQLFMKKQKRQLQKQLITLIPMLQKLNLWAREMNRNLQGKIFIQYRNFTNYQILQSLKNQTFRSRINLQIKIINYEEGRSYNWSINVFENRYEIIENLFQKYLENSGLNYFADKQKDPFWEPKDFQPYAVGYLSLEPLCYALDYEGQINLVYKGNIIATLEVSLHPTIDNSKLKSKLSSDQLVGEQIQDPHQLLEKDLYFTISVDKLKPTQYFPIEKTKTCYISYDLIEDGFKTRTYKTQELSTKKLDIMYALRHSFRSINEHTLAYLSDSPICFTLNLTFQFDDELSSMTSSFTHTESIANLSHSLTENSFNNSSEGSKTDISAILSSNPTNFKKKAPVVFENQDVLGKIQKDYTSAEKKKQREKAEKLSPASSNKKKKGKDDKECAIF